MYAYSTHNMHLRASYTLPPRAANMFLSHGHSFADAAVCGIQKTFHWAAQDVYLTWYDIIIYFVYTEGGGAFRMIFFVVFICFRLAVVLKWVLRPPPEIPSRLRLSATARGPDGDDDPSESAATSFGPLRRTVYHLSHHRTVQSPRSLQRVRLV